MTGHIGFSYVGAIFLAMLFVPNLIWMRKQPKGYETQSENKALLLLERIGQVLVTAAAVMFSDFNLRTWSPWSLWLVAAFALMVLYEIWWVRYFRGKRTMQDMYAGFAGVPVAGATLPVLAFFLLGVYGKVIWLMLAVIILGIGHIGIHLQHRASAQKEQE